MNIYAVYARNFCQDCGKKKDRKGKLCKKCFVEHSLKCRLRMDMEKRALKKEFEKELPEMYVKAKKELQEEFNVKE